MQHSGIPDSELVALITRGYESKEVEYKGPMVWSTADTKARCGLAKDILALANHGGGFLVIGVTQTSDRRFVPSGLSNEQLKSFETTQVNQFTNSYADPPINTTLRKLWHDEKHFVVIAVPGFSHTPHVCIKAYPDMLTAATLYLRTDNNESAPASRAADYQHIVERALRNRTDTLLESLRAVLSGSQARPSPAAEDQYEAQVGQAQQGFAARDPHQQKGYTGYVETVIFPALFDANRFPLAQLRAAATAAHVLYRGWSFLHTTDRTDRMYVVEDALECSVQNRWAGHDEHDFWRLCRSGLLFHKRLLWEDATGAPKSLSFVGLIYHMAEAADALVRLYASLRVPDDEEITVRFRLTDAKDRQLRSFDPDRILSEDFVSQSPIVEIRRSAALAQWRAGLRDHAVAMATQVFAQFNWLDPNSEVLREIVDKLLNRQL